MNQDQLLETGKREEAVKEEIIEQGRYVYCVAKSGNYIIDFGKIGIEGNKVYGLTLGDLCAVVHDCKAEPYKSDDEKTVKEWVKAHQRVVDFAGKKLGSVIPLTFDMIIKGKDPNKEVLDWLKTEQDNLKRKIGKIKGRQEFGIQICWKKEIIGEEIAKTNDEIKKLKKEVNETSKGKAYFHEQKIKDILKKEMEKKADDYFKKFYDQIKNQVEEIKVGKTKKVKQGEQMLMNLSVLIKKQDVKKLGAELDKLNQLNGIMIKFTGPWPAYSFVGTS